MFLNFKFGNAESFKKLFLFQRMIIEIKLENMTLPHSKMASAHKKLFRFLAMTETHKISEKTNFKNLLDQNDS